MLSRSPPNVYDRSNPFGPRTFMSQLSFSARSDYRHPPISRPVAQGMFNQRPNFWSDCSIAGIMQFNQYSH